MTKFTTATGGLCVLLLCGLAIAAPADRTAHIASGCSPARYVEADPLSSHAASASGDSAAELRLDPVIFFQKLVNRYRGLHLYRDVVSVVQVTQREGAETSRIETKIACEVADGKLRVQTPASQARKGLGLDVPLKQSQPMKDAQHQYDLWLAPHMTLKFTEEPLKQLRTGINEGFTATEAESVTIDNKKMVHVELRSGCTGESQNENCNATVNLYVNSDSMLIERIETEQRLPDGASYSTTLDITPEEVQGEMPSAEPVEVPATQQMPEPAV